MSNLFTFSCGIIMGMYITQNYKIPLIKPYIEKIFDEIKEIESSSKKK